METGSPKSEKQNLMYRIINIHRTSNNFSIIYLDRYIVGDFFEEYKNERRVRTDRHPCLDHIGQSRAQ